MKYNQNKSKRKVEMTTIGIHYSEMVIFFYCPLKETHFIPPNKIEQSTRSSDENMTATFKIGQLVSNADSSIAHNRS